MKTNLDVMIAECRAVSTSIARIDLAMKEADLKDMAILRAFCLMSLEFAKFTQAMLLPENIEKLESIEHGFKILKLSPRRSR